MVLADKISQMALLLQIYILILSIALSLGASFEESCGADILCDSSAHLSCINSTCACINPKEMRFDETKKKCVVKSGEKCDLGQPQGKLDCVENANCNEAGYCECNQSKHDLSQHYVGDEEGLCVQHPKKIRRSTTKNSNKNKKKKNRAHGRAFSAPSDDPGRVGENCTSDIECGEDSLLACENGTCSCNSTLGMLDKKTGKCAFRVGNRCMFGEEDPDFVDWECVSGSYCDYSVLTEDLRCISELDNLPSKEGTSHGARCQGNSPCNEQFVCANGRCQCPFPSHQYFNSSIGQCVSYVRGPCSRKMDGVQYTSPCATNAECNGTVGEGAMECVCKPGWIESVNRTCRLAHGQNCSNELIGDTEQNGHEHDCDPIGGLVCINEKCSCPGLQVYDENQLRCRGLAGAICSPGKEGFCTDGANCIKSRWADDVGVCKKPCRH